MLDTKVLKQAPLATNLASFTCCRGLRLHYGYIQSFRINGDGYGWMHLVFPIAFHSSKSFTLLTHMFLLLPRCPIWKRGEWWQRPPALGSTCFLHQQRWRLRCPCGITTTSTAPAICKMKNTTSVIPASNLRSKGTNAHVLPSAPCEAERQRALKSSTQTIHNSTDLQSN